MTLRLDFEGATGSWMRQAIVPSNISIEIEDLDFFACDLQGKGFQHFIKSFTQIEKYGLKAHEVLCLFLAEEMLAKFASHNKEH